jgi:imidazolonepropionase-like amidohydrolase
MRTVLSGGEIYDGSGGPASRADVAIEDGRIVAIGDGLEGDEGVDLAGAALLPGLIDCHVHVLLPTIDTLRLASMPLTYRTLTAVRTLGLLLDAGITTVRDAAGADLGVKQAVEEGIVRGPAMQISVGLISATGGHGDAWLASGQSLRTLFPVFPGVPDTVADGAEGMRRLVRELIRSGAEVIKVAVSGGVVSPRDAPDSCDLREDEMRMIVAEAEAAGLRVMAHAHSAEAVKLAVRTGVRSIEHGTLLDEEAVALMAEHGTYLVPTLTTPRAILAAARQGQSIDPANLAQAEGVLDAHARSFRMAVEAGVPIAMGTDSGIAPHGDNLDELEAMAELGLPREQCLVATTSGAARLMEREEVGSIEVGRRADLVVIEGDPLEFGTLRERIRRVYKAGERVDRRGEEGA